MTIIKIAATVIHISSSGSHYHRVIVECQSEHRGALRVNNDALESKLSSEDKSAYRAESVLQRTATCTGWLDCPACTRASATPSRSRSCQTLLLTQFQSRHLSRTYQYGTPPYQIARCLSLNTPAVAEVVRVYG